MVLKILSRPGDGEGYEADLVFAHGLNGDMIKTWTHPESQICWPQEWLPKELPKVRVMTYGYNADVAFGNSTADILDHAKGLLTSLVDERDNPNEIYRPLIFIGHSLGGIIIKQALFHAVVDQRYKAIHDSTLGIIFFGTPHRGSSVAKYGVILDRVAHSMLRKPSSKILKALEQNSDELFKLSSNFQFQLPRLQVVSFYEKKPMKGSSSVIVDDQSALLEVPNEESIPVDADHSQICKFKEQDDDTYKKCYKRVARILSQRKENRQTQEDNMSGNEYYLVPRAANTFFTGRVEIGERIKKAFFTADSDTQRRYVITGMGGTGKSEVCLKFVDTHRQNFWAIFWIDCSKPSVAEQEFVHLAKKCDAVVDTFEDAKLWLARAKRRWLLILDNADDPEFDYSQYFPLSTKGSILITSRVPECCVHQTAGHESLGGLELLDAKELLLKSAGFELDTSSENQLKAMEIVQVLGSHTLAITQAGAAVRNHFCPLNGYTLLFKRHRDWLLKYHSSQARSQYGDVYATFEVSAKTLEASNSQTNADAIELLGALANLHYENAPVALFEKSFASMKSAKLQPEEEIEHDLRKLSKWHIARLPTIFHQGLSKSDFVLSIRNALRVLVSSSLITITEDNQGSSISMHSLTHAWAKDRLTLPAQKVAWEAAGSIFALSISLIDEYSTIYWCLQPHAHAFVGYTKDYSSHDHTHVEIDRILVRIGTLFMYNGDHSTAVNLIRQVAVQYVPSQQSLRYIKMKIARCEIFLGKYPSAVNGLKKIYEADKQALAVTHLDRVASQFELANAYMGNGQHKKAAELLEEVVEIQKTTLDVTHPDRLTSQYTLAKAYLALGQYSEALMLATSVKEVEATLEDGPPNNSTNILLEKIQFAMAEKENPAQAKPPSRLRRIARRGLS